MTTTDTPDGFEAFDEERAFYGIAAILDPEFDGAEFRWLREQEAVVGNSARRAWIAQGLACAVVASGIWYAASIDNSYTPISGYFWLRG